MRQIHINKTVSKSFIGDFVASVQNLFGWNIKPYEKMLDKAMKQIWDEVGDKSLSWYRFEITQLTSGALSVTLYGEVKE